MADDRPHSTGRLARIGVDVLLWTVVVVLWELAKDYLMLFGYVVILATASGIESGVPAVGDSQPGTLLLGQLILATPFIVLGILAFFVGLIEGLTSLAPRPFFLGSAFGLLAGGVLWPRLVAHSRLAVVVPQAAWAGLVIISAQAVALLLAGLVTAPNKRIERTPRALS